jgi:hypothetical protein
VLGFLSVEANLLLKKKIRERWPHSTPTEERGGRAATSILVGVGVTVWSLQ